MKLNPFSKKTTAGGYLKKIRADYEALCTELASTKAEWSEAEQAHAAEREKQDRLRETAGSMSMNIPPAAKAHWPVLSAAHQHAETLASRVSTLEDQLKPLRRLLEAPEAFAQARRNLAVLTAQRQALATEGQGLEQQLSKIAQRASDLEARIAAETKSATQTLLDAQGEFVVPEALTKLEIELRIARASMTDLQGKLDAVRAQADELPAAIHEARNSFSHWRAVAAEIEVYEQLMPAMTALARATAARRAVTPRHDQSRFEIQIPRELIEDAEASLESEMQAA